MHGPPLTPTESVAVLVNEVGKLTRLGVSVERATVEVARQFGLSPIAVRRLTWPALKPAATPEAA